MDYKVCKQHLDETHEEKEKGIKISNECSKVKYILLLLTKMKLQIKLK